MKDILPYLFCYLLESNILWGWHVFASTLNTCKTFETLTNGLFLSGSDPADWLVLLETDDVTVM